MIDNPTIVVDQIIERLSNYGDIPIVLTGFRSPKELAGLRERYTGAFRIELVYIDARPDIRFKRSQLRARADSAPNREQFDADSKQQADMGLAELERAQDAMRIENNSDRARFFHQFARQYDEHLSMFKLDTKRVQGNMEPMWLEDYIILTLFKEENQDHYYTTAEIAKLGNDSAADQTDIRTQEYKSKNNISRYFNQYFHPFYEIKNDAGKRRYRLSQTGRGHARWLLNNPSAHRPPKYR